ncbi:hypothetical protein NE237_022008 [Protea cynaroides]|uniref:NPR1/NIM1-like C-terminal domain-containing protein n=1 Tax=Protea cynaroides TaxID=273540 RepID=A0A9Q0H9K1_9MAGN|nr:hypothetical protein NE237_022008 [Protea cynaroides]
MVPCFAIQMCSGSDLYFCNTLIVLIGKYRCSSGSTHQVFDEIYHRALGSWTAIISGGVFPLEVMTPMVCEAYKWELSEPEDGGAAVSNLKGLIFKTTHISSRYIAEAFISEDFIPRLVGVLSCGMSKVRIAAARAMYELGSYTKTRKELGEAGCIPLLLKDLSTFKLIVDGYAREGAYTEVLEVFQEMRKAKIKLDKFIIIIGLSVCSYLAALEQGECINAYVHKNCFKVDVVLKTALINLYANWRWIDKTASGTTHPLIDGPNVYSNAFDGNLDTLTAALDKSQVLCLLTCIMGYNQLSFIGTLRVGILAFRKALVNHTRNPLVFATFALAVHNGGDLLEAVNITRKISQPHHLRFSELLKHQNLGSDEALMGEVMDLVKSGKSSIEYPQALYSDLVFIPLALYLRVCRIFDCDRGGKEKGWAHATFPLLDKFLEEDLPVLFYLEKGTLDEQRFERARVTELRDDVQKAFNKDKAKISRSGLSSSSSSSSSEKGCVNYKVTKK